MSGPVTLPSGRGIDSQAKALRVAQALLEKHAEDVVILDVRGLSSVTDFFVLCTAGSRPHLEALREHVQASLVQVGEAVWHVEGIAPAPRDAVQGLRWVLLDCGDLVVHLLDQPARVFYRLEDLWADASRVPLPSEGQSLH